MTNSPIEPPPVQAPPRWPAPPPAPFQYHTAPQKPVWPTTIGVISTVLASLALVATPISLAINNMSRIPNPVLHAIPELYSMYANVTGVIGIGFAALLLAAGINTLKRKLIGRTLHLVYGLVGIIVACVNIPVMIMAFSQANLPPIVRSASIGGIFGAVIGSAYPVFLFIWFLRPKTKEQLNG